jgi:hypothetical protein
MEFKEKEKKSHWLSFSADKILVERDYTMFYILAEARGYAPHSFKAKGKIPLNKLSGWVQNRRTIFIQDERDERDECYDACTIEEALDWQKRHNCRIHYSDSSKKPYRVDSPDFHTDTWLSFDEYEQALNYYRDYTGQEPLHGYLAVYAAMKLYHDSGFKTRLVLCFDN